MNLTEWKEEMLCSVEGETFISCVMEEVPHHPGTARYQGYNTEGTFDKLFDITLDESGEIIKID